MRQPSGLGFALRDAFVWEDFSGLVTLGEELGYRAVFLPEIDGRDAFVALGALAGETRRLLLGTGVVAMGSREPRVTAMAAATVQERSGGRMILGLGTGRPSPGALDRLADQVSTIRSRSISSPGIGEETGVDPDGHGSSPPPIWLAALGPRALRLAGEVADGVLLNWCSPERVTEARRTVHAAASHAGRDPADVTIAVYVRACTIPDAVDALEAAKAATGTYAALPAYAAAFRSMGLSSADVDAAGDAARAGRLQDVPASLAQALVALGPVGSAHDRLRAYRDAGADLVIVYPVAAGPDEVGSVHRTLTDLAPEA
jgi:alkanesulfonate monooxygenase SsuD/methylene tetrahydromethanopterin reductase-like flavin-dependent oxidoreductase (luciferase family)